eukprot:gnl/Ergobibamus_cyprinoides/101.p1 GENE.gnl/Ergobibamus_cyprinoides/101~~gnl/Ergobibamus_cyprinoides/101.p1  ORF type:complete len:327 (+),score=35.04 gnl/Ergobibamus_cyprinoides/101:135-1115(+)
MATDGSTALMVAAKVGNASTVEALVPFEAGLRRHDACCALHAAAKFGHLECVKILAPHEHLLQSNVGRTPLFSAALAGHTDVVRALAALPGALGAVDKAARTPAMFAALEARLDCLPLLTSQLSMRSATGETALHYAALGGSTAACELVLRLCPHLAKVHSFDGNTALMHAASHGHDDVVRCLAPIQAGLFDDSHTTACMQAAALSFPRVVDILAPLEGGLRDELGASAMHMAAGVGNAACCELLLPFEAGLADDDGATALMLAASVGHVEVTQLLAPYECGRIGVCADAPCPGEQAGLPRTAYSMAVARSKHTADVLILLESVDE